MTQGIRLDARKRIAFLLALAVLAALFAVAPPDLPARAAGEVTIRVFDRETGDPVPEFRYIVNVDIAHQAEDGRPPSEEGPESFSPVVAKGEGTNGTATVNGLDEGKYLVSVIAGEGPPAPGQYKMSGKHFTLGANAETVDVHVIGGPLPLSQIKVVVHHDNYMVNGAQDIPQEQGLAGFSVLLEDGTGEVSADFFGNPICAEYDTNGAYKPGTGGQCITDENGEVTIPNLAAHKYGVFAVPPDGSGWIQTSTLEGTHVIDAWIEEGNSGLITEAGVQGPLVSLGYVQECEFGLCPQLDNQGNLSFPSTPTVAQGDATITGLIREATEAGEATVLPGPPIDRPYIALNNLSGNDEQVYTGRGNPDGTFEIANVPPGTYQLVVWDEPQLYIISFATVVVGEDDTNVDVGDILLPGWFGHIQGFAYEDTGVTVNGDVITGIPEVGSDPALPGYANGFRDCLPAATSIFDYGNCEPGVANQDFVIHFNDGSVKYGGVSDSNGYYSFDEHFPYGHYMIWEVGFGRNAQSLTAGYFAALDEATGRMVPQGYPYEPVNQTAEPQGASLLQAEITLASYYNWIDTGKLPYDAEMAGENGGISGVVRYAVTRNEFDPRLAAAEDYEPGVPNVPINLYHAALDANQEPIACNDPGPGCPYGEGELKRVSTGTGIDAGDVVDSVETDSYYASRPTDCTYPDPVGGIGFVNDPDCLEVPINIRQIQDGVFDGGYAFDPQPNGWYIVEVVPPENYRHLKEEDQNTDQGDDFIIPDVEPADCAGPLHYVVPSGRGNPLDGQDTPLCDSKLVEVKPATNPAADFFLMVDFDDSVDANGVPVDGFAGTTEVPPPGLMRGILFDDLTVQFNTNSVMYGGKKGVANTPVGILDFQGNEIAVVDTDDEGFFEVLLPSTFTRLCPTPGGVCAGIYLVVGNYPGQDPQHPLPNWNPNYQTLTLPLDMWTGKTTYADVAILPITGFGFAEPPVCEAVGPVIDSVSQVVVPRASNSGFTISGSGFGNTVGTVRLGETEVATTAWSDTQITVAALPNSGQPSTLVPYGPRQLSVIAGGLTSETGITIHVTGGPTTGPNAALSYNPTVRHVGSGQTYDTIQAAISAAVQPMNTSAPDLIVVHPGTYYESPIIPKRVKLQGFGPAVTSIDGRFLGFGNSPIFDLQSWVDTLNMTSVVGPGAGADDVPVGQVLTVVAQQAGTHTTSGQGAAGAALRYTQIDGFTIIGGDSARGDLGQRTSQGGGIYAHSAVHNLQVSNNLIQSNAGNAGGGIILGRPYVGDNNNDNVRIHHNRVLNNGGTILAGGIGIFNGAGSYTIDHNVICGNHSAEYGGGISHFGRSGRSGNSPAILPSTIADNRIVFNSAFDEGGGITIAGELPLDPTTVSGGSGDVTITRNLIQYNLSNDDGGGIRLLMPESAGGGTSADATDRVSITNNMIVNNLATDFGGGIALDDAPDTRIINNTIARNVSTATAEDADTTSCGLEPGDALSTCPHAAGITSTPHSAALLQALNLQEGFSDPLMFNNIIWENRAFSRNGNGGLNPLDEFGVWDLEVVGSNGQMKPKFSILTNDPINTDYQNGEGNQLAVPGLVDPIVTDFSALPLTGLEPNFVGVQINATPADDQGDYHLATGSAAIDTGTPGCNTANGSTCAGGSTGGNPPTQVLAPPFDFDLDTRPQGPGYDIGADEVPQ